jgi:hypothetical protein
MTSNERSAIHRRLVLAIATLALGVGLISLTATPALACSCEPFVLTAGSSEPSDSGFPLLGWLSLVAVLGLGLMPVALWVRFRQRDDS